VHLFHDGMSVVIVAPMGSAESSVFNDLFEWITERAFADTNYATEFRHLTNGEKIQIERTIGRCLQTNRRVETRLLEVGAADPDVLQALSW
jgi:hypothetical protein